METTNLLLLTDSYKVSHHRQYPPGTEVVYSYFESRGGDFPETVFFGLRYILMRYLVGRVVTHFDIDRAKLFYAAHFGRPDLFNEAGWRHIAEVHGGALPIRIRAVPEGTVVPTHNVLMTVRNTCHECFWLTNYLETILSHCWYGTTVATQSRAIKLLIREQLERTGDAALLDFKLHDFGCRGVSSVESAAVGGAAHLINFKGTDTVPGLWLAREYYGEPMAGFSIPAAEHSTITSWGQEHEVDAFRNMIQQFGSGGAGLYAVVSDSFDIFHACDVLWGQELKAEVLEAPNTLVIRPDSGTPHVIVATALETLGRRFGFTVNAKGFKVLNPKIRLIQGDGVDMTSIAVILDTMRADGWSADNIAFGMGGALLQKLNRDTCKFAFKCSSVTVNGEERDVYKAPATDPGKNSKRGRLRLVRGADGTLRTYPANHWVEGQDELVEYFSNGEMQFFQTFGSIREFAALDSFVEAD